MEESARFDSTWARVERVMRGYLFGFVCIVAGEVGGSG